MAATSVTTATIEPTLHSVGALDQALVAQVRALALQASTPACYSIPVPVRFSTHVSSDHIVSFERSARPIVVMPRESFSQTIGAWMAPYQFPPSIDGLMAEMQDLWVEN